MREFGKSKLIVNARLDGRKTLAGYDLRGQDFSGQDLRGIRIENTSLEYANLEGANLEGAVFDTVYLNYANLEGANLKGVNFIAVEAQQADFRNADLSNSTALSQTLKNNKYYYPPRFDHADFRGANLTNIKFERPAFVGAILSEANLTGATLIKADLKSARLIEANLTGANLDNCYLWYTNLSRATLDGAAFSGCQLPCAILDGASARGTGFVDISLYVSPNVPDHEANVNVNNALDISVRGVDGRGLSLNTGYAKYFFNFIYNIQRGAGPMDPLSAFLYELGIPLTFCIYNILPPYEEYINKHIEGLEARIISLYGVRKSKSPATTITRALDNNPDMADAIFADIDMTVSMCLENVDIRLAY